MKRRDPMPSLAILAGGLATRMRPLTDRVAKCMLDVAGQPFIAHQLRLVRREGVERVVLCVGYLAEQIKDYVGDGREFGIQVLYSFEDPQLLSTGGALKQALPLLSDPFLIMYGDTYLDVRFAPIIAAFERWGKDALMTVYRNEGRWDTSNIEFVDGAIRHYDKQNRTAVMQHIDYGLAMLKAAVFNVFPANEPFDLMLVYQRLLERGELAGYEVHQRFYEIGTPEGLADADRYLRERTLR